MTAPSPRDWTEDRAHENGNYLCFCVTCKQRFIGHKRRCVCKVCVNDAAEENSRREHLLDKAGLSPAEWELMTVAEVQRMHAQYANLLLELNVERNLRRDLTTAFNRLADCISSTRGPDAHYALEDGRETVAKSEHLDAEIAAKHAADHTPAR